jgi:hypothetical protein
MIDVSRRLRRHEISQEDPMISMRIRNEVRDMLRSRKTLLLHLRILVKIPKMKIISLFRVSL